MDGPAYHGSRARRERPERNWNGREGDDDDLDNDPELHGLEYSEFRRKKREKLRVLQRHLLWRITPSPSPSPPPSPGGDRRVQFNHTKAGDGPVKSDSEDVGPLFPTAQGSWAEDANDVHVGNGVAKQVEDTNGLSGKTAQGKDPDGGVSKRSLKKRKSKDSSSEDSSGSQSSSSSDSESDSSDDDGRRKRRKSKGKKSSGRKKGKRSSSKRSKSKSKKKSSKGKSRKRTQSSSSASETSSDESAGSDLESAPAPNGSPGRMELPAGINRESTMEKEDQEIAHQDLGMGLGGDGIPQGDTPLAYDSALELRRAAAAAAEANDFVGPAPAAKAEGHISYGGALRPGEGDAIAQYVQQGKRIPRRGEVGLSADEISKFEDLGYVMSGSRHQRMNAIRIRKENQVYSAEDKRALAMFNYEEKAKREHKVMSDLQRLVQRHVATDAAQDAEGHEDAE